MATSSLAPAEPGGRLNALMRTRKGPFGMVVVLNASEADFLSAATTNTPSLGVYPLAGNNSAFWIFVPSILRNTLPLNVAPSSGAVTALMTTGVLFVAVAEGVVVPEPLVALEEAPLVPVPAEGVPSPDALGGELLVPVVPVVSAALPVLPVLEILPVLEVLEAPGVVEEPDESATPAVLGEPELLGELFAPAALPGFCSGIRTVSPPLPPHPPSMESRKQLPTHRLNLIDASSCQFKELPGLFL